MVDMLLRHGAELCDTNDRGDTVFHSLIRFSALYPEKESKAVELMAELHRRLKDKVSFQHSSVRQFPLGDTTDTEISLHPTSWVHKDPVTHKTADISETIYTDRLDILDSPQIYHYTL